MLAGFIILAPALHYFQASPYTPALPFTAKQDHRIREKISHFRNRNRIA
jgi:hypothetical protein